jgi:pyruvate kinase
MRLSGYLRSGINMKTQRKIGAKKAMNLPGNKTKIVCTLGPASGSREVIEKMIRAGMDVARLNLSHGDLESHKKAIANLRSAARGSGVRIAVMADLPGPKMRIGQFREEPVELKPDSLFTLTTEETEGDEKRVSVSFARLPLVVRPGNTLFINDGLIQLKVIKTSGDDVICRVIIGGELSSRKGLNMPGIDLGMSAFTDDDHQCLKFAKEQGLEAVSQSFVESGSDITDVRRAAEKLGYNPFIIAKIERSRAVENIDDILAEADGIMIARGDLGVETPIEQIPLIQKQLMNRANLLGKPVITATQMLESMTTNRRPTRAEATDVANAILDGTDCVMLSGESAMGKYPVESVSMLAKIAAVIEPHRRTYRSAETIPFNNSSGLRLADLISLSVEATMEYISPAAVFVPTRSGATARSISRFRLPVWIIGVSSQESTCLRLRFSYGVYPVLERDHPDDWNLYIRKWLRSHSVSGNLVILTEGPSSKHPDANNRMEIIDLNSRR